MKKEVKLPEYHIMQTLDNGLMNVVGFNAFKEWQEEMGIEDEDQAATLLDKLIEEDKAKHD